MGKTVINILRIVLFLLVTYSLKTSFRVQESKLPPLANFFSPFSGFWQNADPVKEPGISTFVIDGIGGDAEIVWDDRGVPHIFSSSYRDAIFLQGYIHAKDRLWQMDFSTRAAAGRISEILGPIALEFDKDKRRKGLLSAAKKTVKDWKNFPRSWELLEAYTAGVNTYLETLPEKKYPLEFKLLQYAPEKWSPLKTCLFFKSMAEVLCSRNKDLPTTNSRAILGDSLFTQLFPESFNNAQPIIPSNVVWPDVPDSLLYNYEVPGLKGALFGVESEADGQEGSGIGSNNWAVAPEKTLNGNAILCNDPHLKLNLPSVWYETHIVCPETNVYGVSFPGAPGVIIGFNENITFGFTNTGIDVFDWYAIDWVDQAKTRYRIGQDIYEVKYRVDTIRVKGQQDVLDSVKITKYGPVFTENTVSPYRDLAFHWIANDMPGTDEMGTFLYLNLSEKLSDYKNAISGFFAPAQNMIYADAEGNIALTVQGRFPVRAYQQGRFILDGSLPDLEWKKLIPSDFKPQVVNPERGFVSSANQRPTDTSYPFYYSSGDFRPYRGTMINLKLDTMKGITPGDMKALQLDNESLHARKLLPPLLENLRENQLSEEEMSLKGQLSLWDHQYTRSENMPILFEIWADEFRIKALDELAVKMPDYEVRFPNDWILAELLSDSSHVIWDQVSTPLVENAGDIVTESFSNACSAFTSLMEEKPAMDWGKYKATRIMHMARIEAFSSDTLYTSGAAEAINAIKEDEGPSWRMVVEMGDKVKAWGIYPGGQSGNPGNIRYDNMIIDWQEGRYYDLKFVGEAEQLLEVQNSKWIINE